MNEIRIIKNPSPGVEERVEFPDGSVYEALPLTTESSREGGIDLTLKGRIGGGPGSMAARWHDDRERNFKRMARGIRPQPKRPKTRMGTGLCMTCEAPREQHDARECNACLIARHGLADERWG